MSDPSHRSLTLMRHAKSAWDLGVASDHLRPLNERGRRAVPVIGSFLADLEYAPDLVLCSTATRTRETLDRLLRDFPQAPTLRYEQGLYLAEGGDYLERLRRMGKRWRRVLVIAHNPGLQDLAAHLIGEANPALARQIADKFPTAALAMLDCSLENWTDLGPGCVRAARYVSPKKLV